jgi:hypothetical protein
LKLNTSTAYSDNRWEFVPGRFEKGPDVTVSREGNLFLFQPLTGRAQEWFEFSTPDATRWAGAVVVEHRYAEDVALGLKADGLKVE